MLSLFLGQEPSTCQQRLLWRGGSQRCAWEEGHWGWGRDQPEKHRTRRRHIPMGHSKGTDAARAQVTPGFCVGRLAHTLLCHLVALGTWASHLIGASASHL